MTTAAAIHATEVIPNAMSLVQDIPLVAVFVAQVSPIAMNVAHEEILRLLSCHFESGQRAGRRDDLAEREKR
jgi:hypothetical protein